MDFLAACSIVLLYFSRQGNALAIGSQRPKAQYGMWAANAVWVKSVCRIFVAEPVCGFGTLVLETLTYFCLILRLRQEPHRASTAAQKIATRSEMTEIRLIHRVLERERQQETLITDRLPKGSLCR
jgi:hypothetical protein